MTNIDYIPLQDNYDTTLTDLLSNSATALTVSVKETPSYTPTTEKTYGIVNPGKSNAELVLIKSYDSTALTITIESAGRAQPLYKGDTGSIQEHVSGSQLILSDNYSFWQHIADAVNSKANSFGLPCTAYADTTARDAAIPTPINGMQCYITADGKFNDYTAGSWVVRESGGTFANASETVAGKVEVATTAEALAGTDTGTTGAKLVMTPANGAIVDSAQIAAGYIPKTDSAGVVSKELIEGLKGTGSTVIAANLDTLTNSGNADALHSHVGAEAECGEVMDGSSTPKAVWIADTAGTKTENLTQLLSTSSFNMSSAAYYVMQSVTFHNASEITEFKLYVNKIGSPSDLILDIYAADGSGEPTGSSLSTETGSESAGVVTFAISPTVTIGTNPKQYCFVIKPGATVGASDYYAAIYQNTDVYSEGAGHTSSDSGSSWSASIGDFKFDTSGTYPQTPGLIYIATSITAFTGFINASYIKGDTVNLKTDGELKGFTGLSLGQYYTITTGGVLSSGSSATHVCIAVGTDSIFIDYAYTPTPVSTTGVVTDSYTQGSSGGSHTFNLTVPAAATMVVLGYEVGGSHVFLGIQSSGGAKSYTVHVAAYATGVFSAGYSY